MFFNESYYVQYSEVNKLFLLLTLRTVVMRHTPCQVVGLMLHGLTSVVKVILNMKVHVLTNLTRSSETVTAGSSGPKFTIKYGYLQKIVSRNSVRGFLFRKRFFMVLFGDRRCVQSYTNDAR